jgi:hypothetical protein
MQAEAFGSVLGRIRQEGELLGSKPSGPMLRNGIRLQRAANLLVHSNLRRAPVQ